MLAIPANYEPNHKYIYICYKHMHASHIEQKLKAAQKCPLDQNTAVRLQTETRSMKHLNPGLK